jgi:hypothetical protein
MSMLKPKPLWETLAEVTIVVLVLAAILSACVLSVRDCSHDIGCQMKGGDIVKSAGAFSIERHRCLLDGKVER